MNLSPEQRTIAAQRARIDELEETVRQLRDERRAVQQSHPVYFFPRDWKLSAAEVRAVVAFAEAKNGFLSNQEIYKAVSTYTMVPNKSECVNLVKVYICKLRKKLRPRGIELFTRHGQGYEIYSGSQAVIIAAMQQVSTVGGDVKRDNGVRA